MAEPLTNCSECPCAKWKGNRVVPLYEGGKRTGFATYREIGFRGNKKADLMIVGESPGAWEVERGACFVGDSGVTVAAKLKELGVDPASVFFANVCRCMLIKRSTKVEDGLTDREMKQAEACCVPAVKKAIQLVKPKVVILYGNSAMRALLKQSGITKYRGREVWSEEFQTWFIPMYHPAYCLRDHKHFAFWNPDMDKAIKLLRESVAGTRVAATEDSIHTEEVDSIDFLLKRSNFSVALDTETQGTDRWSPNHVVLSYSVSDSESQGWNIVLWEECEPGEEDRVITWERDGEPVQVYIRKAANYETKIRELRELLTRPDIKKYMMTGYDLHQFEWLGIPATEIKSYVMDIQTAAHCLDPDVYKADQASLQNLRHIFCPEVYDHKKDELVDKTDMLKSLREHRELFTKYAAADTAVTFAVAQRLREHLLQDKKLAYYYTHFVHPVSVEVLHRIESVGVEFDLERLPEVKEQIAETIRDIEQRVIALIPEKVRREHEGRLKLTRGDLIRDVLFSKKGFGLPVQERTATLKPAIGRKMLGMLAEDLGDHPASEFIMAYLEWGPYNKLYTTYLTGFERFVRGDGKLHTQISTAFTATGRSGSRNPNLQNIPKRNPTIARYIRQLIKAPPGYRFLAMDYSQNELRWTAYRANEPTMIKAYQEGIDLHRLTASRIMGVPLDKVTKEQRQAAKAVNFGLIYGMGAEKFRVQARTDYGVVLTLEQATAWREKFLYELYTALPLWHDREIRFARKHGYCRTPFGRIRRLPNITSQEPGPRSEAERCAINTPIQSAGSDTALYGVLEAIRRGVVDGKRCQIALFIHDELVFLVQEDAIMDVYRDLKEVLEHPPLERFGIKFPIPLEVDAKVGPTLGDLQEIQ